MGYRQVFIRKSEKIQFRDNQLLITKEGNEFSLPLEDINYIILEDVTTVITAKLLSELGKNAIALLVCDDKHEPTSILYPYNYHFKQLEVLEKQLSFNDEGKAYLWKLIIEKKIANQIAVLEKTTQEESVIIKIKEFQETVDNGDITIREGLAAKMYFRSLFGSDFIRQYDDGVNAALNYGYSILKSAIVRNLAVFGLNSYLGINHKSKTNNFNLTYDLIEPFRPVVDHFVYEHSEELVDHLSFDIRKKLVDLLNYPMIINKRKCTIEYAIELLIKSYVKVLESGVLELDLPDIS